MILFNKAGIAQLVEQRTENPRVTSSNLVPGKTTFLGWKDSNLRVAGPKPAALPLGDTPLIFLRLLYDNLKKIFVNLFFINLNLRFKK